MHDTDNRCTPFDYRRKMKYFKPRPLFNLLGKSKDPYLENNFFACFQVVYLISKTRLKSIRTFITTMLRRLETKPAPQYDTHAA
jgi:hypothetical protein